MKTPRRKYENQVFLKAKTQPKLFFAHSRRNRLLKKTIIGLKDNEGDSIFAPPAQAELLKNFYSSIFREYDTRLTPPLPVPTVVMPVPLLSSPDMSKGAGPDEIHPQVVRWLADFLAEPFSKLFANSLTTAVVSIDQRIAILYPIYKKVTKSTFPTNAT